MSLKICINRIYGLGKLSSSGSTIYSVLANIMCTTVLGTKILPSHMSRKTPAYNPALYRKQQCNAKFVANQISSTNKKRKI
jgi:hypothetical protein